MWGFNLFGSYNWIFVGFTCKELTEIAVNTFHNNYKEKQYEIKRPRNKISRERF